MKWEKNKLIADSSKLRGQRAEFKEVGPVVVPGGRDYAAARKIVSCELRVMGCEGWA